MTDELVDVTSVAVVSGTVLRLSFNNGKSRLVDVRPLMIGPVYDEVFLKDMFDSVSVDPEAGTIVWPNGADLPPDRLYRDPIEVNASDGLVEQIETMFREAFAQEGHRSGHLSGTSMPSVRNALQSGSAPSAAPRVIRWVGVQSGTVRIHLSDRVVSSSISLTGRTRRARA